MTNSLGVDYTLRPTNRLAPVAPIVHYTGALPWSGAPRVIDLVMPGASDAGDGEAGVALRSNSLFAAYGYLILDTLRVAADDWRHGDAVALLVALDNPSSERIAAQVAALYRRLGTRDLAPLRELMLRWAQQAAKRRIHRNLGIRDMAEADRLHESGDLVAYYAARLRAGQDEYRAEGRAQCIEQGTAAEQDLLHRQAARKFGASTAERLAGLLAKIGDSHKIRKKVNTEKPQ